MMTSLAFNELSTLDFVCLGLNILPAESNASNRGGSRAAATSKMERFVIIVNGFQPLTIITKRSFLDVATVLDPPLSKISNVFDFVCFGKQYLGTLF